MAEAGCRLALILALDISSSVDAREDALQRGGLAAALVASEVVEAALSVPGEPVALAIFEWSGRYQQDMLLPWTLLTGPEDLLTAAERIATSKRSYAEFPTALGYALGYAAGVFRDAPECLRKTIDVSGDGVNNDGFGPHLAYAHFPLDGVTVNGLAITGQADDLIDYYRRELIRGPGAFVIEATSFADFERAMREKLRREMEAPVLGLNTR
ncbi:MAG: DUF1194 domain-containing protein [Pseudomonadota bacterium]